MWGEAVEEDYGKSGAIGEDGEPKVEAYRLI